MSATRADAVIELGGAEVMLCPERGAFLAGERTLLVADLHLGKSETFRRGGAAIPAGVTDEQLGRLDAMIDRLTPERVIVLGDLIHAPIGVTVGLVARIGAWTEAARRRGVGVGLVRGNHDEKLGRRLRDQLDDMGVDDLGALITLGRLTLAHDAIETATRPTIGGHHHPAVRLERDRGEWGTKIPAFHLTADGALTLPAFSRFTAGGALRPARGESVYAIAADRVIPLCSPRR